MDIGGAYLMMARYEMKFYDYLPKSFQQSTFLR
jgi:hypothetical protein